MSTIDAFYAGRVGDFLLNGKGAENASILDELLEMRVKLLFNKSSKTRSGHGLCKGQSSLCN